MRIILKGGKRIYKKFSIRLKERIFAFQLKDAQLFNNKLIISMIDKIPYNNQNILITMPKDEKKKYPNWISDTEVQLNKYISVRLIEDETQIDVAGELFSQCKYLLLEIPDVCISEQVDSIDDAERYFSHKLERIEQLEESEELEGSSEDIKEVEITIPTRTEFFGHISNLQAWIENDYDTRILHRNLAFPLLKRLADVGDPLAKIKLKEEVVKRIKSGNENVIIFILEGNYINLFNWTPEEIDLLFSIPNLNAYTYYLIYIKIRNYKTIPKEFMKLFKESVDQLFNKAESKTLRFIYPILPDLFTKKEFEAKPNNKIIEIETLYKQLEVWQKEFEKIENRKISDIEDHSFVDEDNFFHIVYKIFTISLVSSNAPSNSWRKLLTDSEKFFFTFHRLTSFFLAKVEAINQLSQIPIPLMDEILKRDSEWLEEYLDYDKMYYDQLLKYEKEMNNPLSFKKNIDDFIKHYAFFKYFPKDDELWNLLGIKNEKEKADDVIKRNANRWTEIFPLLSKSSQYKSFKSFIISNRTDDLKSVLLDKPKSLNHPNLINKYLNIDSASEDIITMFGNGFFLSNEDRIYELPLNIFYWRIK